jgi:imidazolonepropionase-like amidohydrolase
MGTQATQTAVKVGRLIDGRGGPVLRNATVLIQGKRIKAVGPSPAVELRPGTEVIDAADLTMMPGMIDTHLHLCMFNNLTFKNYRVAQWEVTHELQQMYMLFHAQLCLERGFTTLRDLGYLSPKANMIESAVAVRDAINAGIMGGPRLVCAAFTVGTGSHLDLINPRAHIRQPGVTADGVEDMRRLARRNLLVGADWLKTCASGGGGTDKEAPDVRNHTQAELDLIVDEAHAQHKYCSIHCFTPQAQQMALDARADTIEHMVFHSAAMNDKLAAAQVPVVPTLSHRTDDAIAIRRETGTPPFTLDKMKGLQEHCFDTFRAMYRNGVKIAMGTDMGFEPDMGSNADELAIYVDLGMKPMEAILTATKTAAEALHLDKDIGTIEPGKFADLVLVKGDPSEDIKVLKDRLNIQTVWKEGRRFLDRRPGEQIRTIPYDYQSWKVFS